MDIKLYSCVLDCKEPGELADFYARLLGWILPFQNEDFAVLAPPDTAQGAYPGITFQRNPDYQPPVWPEKPGKQQQMAHLDFAVRDMAQAAQYAVSCGATLAEKQFSPDWTVLFDPAGHPFCLCQMPHIFDGPDFGLR